ncbi:MAG TPA: FGGY-family carbohydrate kinase [Rhodothermales bacterium]|nr:FGGY-family carbohydrate kinase [Rhodothermales bacterium]
MEHTGSNTSAVGKHMDQRNVFIGVDVGTGSARAGVFDHNGHMLASAAQPIRLWREGEVAEQSTEDIWQACSTAVRQAARDAGITKESVKGIGFDATCSLAVVGADGRPVTVSASGDPQRNVIVWMDHRALEETETVNATGHEVLRYVGGKVSPEMQSPKLLWLKRHLPESWRKAHHFLDLPDYLTFRATGETTRSLCTTVCKWTYLGHEERRRGGWSDDFWRSVGLGDLVEEGYGRIGTSVRPMGEALGNGLTPEAAQDFGLLPGTAVGVSIIDAHAGGIGVLGVAPGGSQASDDFEDRLALIGGTSSCHMAASREPRFISGIWGPYYSAMIPGQWLTEGGQSATGALIDHVIFSHVRGPELQRQAATEGRTVYELLNERCTALAARAEYPAFLTRDLHVLPYFHGNRSPRANPTLRGGISGLRLSDSVDELALLYLAAIQAVAYGTRHIVEEMNRAGYRIDTIVACGGGTRNPVFLREHADATGCRILLPREPEAVLLGSAMLGAVAAGAYPALPEAMQAMSSAGAVIEPASGQLARYHDKKYRVFHRMYEDQTAYRSIMQTGGTGQDRTVQETLIRPGAAS